jgi:hypothetical protein
VEIRSGSVRLRAGRALVSTLIPVFATVWLAAAPAEAASLSTQVATATQPMGNAAGTATNAVAQCPSGATLVGGGIEVGRAADTATPANGLKVNGTMPSDSGGNPVTNGGTDPSFWTAVGGFGGQSEAGDQVTSFAMCSTGGPAHTTVVTASVSGVATQGNPPLIATASCPSGTSLVGGGALGTPPSEASFKPIASYPSNSAGVASANGDQNPTSWSAYGSAGAPNPATQVTTAFAACSTDATVQTQVARADSAGPQAASTFTTSAVACASGTLLDGGVSADLNGAVPQQGVHLRGSYPSDATGTPVTNGALNPGSWSAIVQAGGQATTGTSVHVFALCGAGPQPVVSESHIAALLPLSAAVLFGGAILFRRRRGATPRRDGR